MCRQTHHIYSDWQSKLAGATYTIQEGTALQQNPRHKSPTMTGARSFIKDPDALLEAACEGFLATHPHLQYDESHRGACMSFFKFPKLAEVETSPSPWGLDVASPKCKQANESCISNSDLQKLSWQLRARHSLERR